MPVICRALCWASVACRPAHTLQAPEPRGDNPPNLLLVLLDDVGTDKIDAYKDSTDAPPTETIGALAAEGILFRNVWAAPVCAPTRGMLMTGRMGRRYGLGQNFSLTSSSRLPDTERLLPRLLAEAPVPYTSAIMGKWGLVGLGGGQEQLADPLERGFVTHKGPPDNVQSYIQWFSSTDGVGAQREGYLTTATVDDALAVISVLPEPFLLVLSFNAPHEPAHVPPAPLNGYGVDETDEPANLYDAALVALDLELGRLLREMNGAVRDHTAVVVMGDNGTPGYAMRAPFISTHGKGTMYEGGIRVPLIVSGLPAQVQGESDVLASLVDVTATLLDVAGVDPSALALDGHSLLPALEDPTSAGPPFTYTEYLTDNGPPPWPDARTAVRDHRYKLVSYDGLGSEQLFALDDRVDDGPDLLLSPLSAESSAALSSLRAERERILAQMPYEGP